MSFFQTLILAGAKATFGRDPDHACPHQDGHRYVMDNTPFINKGGGWRRTITLVHANNTDASRRHVSFESVWSGPPSHRQDSTLPSFTKVSNACFPVYDQASAKPASHYAPHTVPAPTPAEGMKPLHDHDAHYNHREFKAVKRCSAPFATEASSSFAVTLEESPVLNQRKKRWEERRAGKRAAEEDEAKSSHRFSKLQDATHIGSSSMPSTKPPLHTHAQFQAPCDQHINGLLSPIRDLKLAQTNISTSVLPARPSSISTERFLTQTKSVADETWEEDTKPTSRASAQAFLDRLVHPNDDEASTNTVTLRQRATSQTPNSSGTHVIPSKDKFRRPGTQKPSTQEVGTKSSTSWPAPPFVQSLQGHVDPASRSIKPQPSHLASDVPPRKQTGTPVAERLAAVAQAKRSGPASVFGETSSVPSKISTPALTSAPGSTEENKRRVSTKSNSVLLSQPAGADCYENATSKALKPPKVHSDQKSFVDTRSSGQHVTDVSKTSGHGASDERLTSPDQSPPKAEMVQVQAALSPRLPFHADTTSMTYTSASKPGLSAAALAQSNMEVGRPQDVGDVHGNSSASKNDSQPKPVLDPSSVTVEGSVKDVDARHGSNDCKGDPSGVVDSTSTTESVAGVPPGHTLDAPDQVTPKQEPTSNVQHMVQPEVATVKTSSISTYTPQDDDIILTYHPSGATWPLMILETIPISHWSTNVFEEDQVTVVEEESNDSTHGKVGSFVDSTQVSKEQLSDDPSKNDTVTFIQKIAPQLLDARSAAPNDGQTFHESQSTWINSSRKRHGAEANRSVNRFDEWARTESMSAPTSQDLPDSFRPNSWEERSQGWLPQPDLPSTTEPSARPLGVSNLWNEAKQYLKGSTEEVAPAPAGTEKKKKSWNSNLLFE